MKDTKEKRISTTTIENDNVKLVYSCVDGMHEKMTVTLKESATMYISKEYIVGAIKCFKELDEVV